MEYYLGITINNDLDNLFSSHGLELLKKYYLLKNETPQKAFARASIAYSKRDLGLAQRIYDYTSSRKFMFSSPILSNAPLPNNSANTKGKPISCFLSHVPDKIKGIIEHLADTCWFTIIGGGVGANWSSVRSADGKSSGPVSFLSPINSIISSYKQGKTRKGSYAAYMDITHPEIVEFITMRIPTGGDINRKNLNLFNAVNITDDFMKAVKNGSDYDLIDPKTKKRTPTSARKMWEMILECRSRTGTPYLNFIDTVNRDLPDTMKDMGLRIRGSNLCNEIHLPTDSKTDAVCCISSINLEYFDDITEQFVRDIIRFLDNVLDTFIEDCPFQIHKAKKGAIRDRPLGLGVMGLGSFFQKKGIPFESEEAKKINLRIFKTIKEYATKETLLLAKERGECESMKGTGRRNSHLLAIAPTSNSSIIIDCSASIEPQIANAYIQKTRAGTFLFKNKYLEKELEKIGMNTKDVWNSIIKNKGSVKHLNISSNIKDIFKTAKEMDQIKIIELAADRQKYICQGQSLNIFISSAASKKYIHDIHYKAWELGCKGLYYYRGEAAERSEDISVLECSRCVA